MSNYRYRITRGRRDEKYVVEYQRYVAERQCFGRGNKIVVLESGLICEGSPPDPFGYGAHRLPDSYYAEKAAAKKKMRRVSNVHGYTVDRLKHQFSTKEEAQACVDHMVADDNFDNTYKGKWQP